MANMKKDNLFVRYYDKLAAVLVLIVLLVSLYYLTTIPSGDDGNTGHQLNALKEREEAREKKPDLEPAPLATYENAEKALSKPMQLAPLPDIHQAGFLIPEQRAQCGNAQCRKPIALAAEKCSFCGAEQSKKVVVAEDMDSDEDGIPDKVEVALGLDPKNPADAKEDMDGDGFSNLEEYQAKTDPKSATSHPSVLVLLRVKEIRAKRMPFILTARNLMPDGIQLVFNTPMAHGQSTIYAKTNSVIGQTGYQVVKFVVSSKKERNQLKGFMETIDTSIATVKRLSDGKEFEIRMGDKRHVETDTEAVITLPLDKKDFPVMEGTSFKVREDTYRVLVIDTGKKSVLIENEKTKQQKLVPPQ
ncbi:MAG: hypothetical protein J6Z49_08560 [Kiritimatiellae bacterium]|nr:hypothetical protein [Kiritimatiellia bacterium]